MNEKTYIVQPKLKNDVRQEVIDWCYQQFGDNHKGQGDEEYLDWTITSNYTRGIDADFDFKCANEKVAFWFVMKYGGDIQIKEHFDIKKYFDIEE
jgi:hypothetical protein